VTETEYRVEEVCSSSTGPDFMPKGPSSHSNQSEP